MSNSVNAHIFKQRSVGEREEVRLRLFTVDGEPIDISAGGGTGITFVNEIADLDPSPTGHPVVLVLDVGDGQMGLFAWNGTEWQQFQGGGGEPDGSDFITIEHDGALAIGDMLVWDGAEFDTEVP